MLDSPNLQSPADLNSLYGDWSTLGAMQGHQNQDLAAQFRQQAYQANANDIDRTGLANTLTAATMPSDIQIKGNTANQGQIKTQQDALGLASAQDAYPDKQALLHKTIARELDDEDLTRESNKYIKAYQQAQLSGNRTEADKYRSVLDTLVGAATAKAADRAQQTALGNRRIDAGITEAGIGAGATRDSAAMHLGGTMYTAQQSNATKEYIANLGKGLEGRAAELSRQRDAETDPSRKAALDAAYNEAVYNKALLGQFGNSLDVKDATGFDRGAAQLKNKAEPSIKDKRDAL